MAGLIAFVIVALVWPALLRASQQFRMANTSWRGLRFRFTGNLGDAYKAVLPLFIPGGLTLLGVLIEPTDEGLPARVGALIPTGGVVIVILAPLFLWLMKKYQHDHYALGQAETELRTGAGSFYLLALKTAGVGVLTAIVVGGGATVIAGGSLAAVFSGGSNSKGIAIAIAIIAAVLLVYLSIFLVVAPYVTARMQDLVWGKTQSKLVRFDSNLRFVPLLGLTVKNWLLTIISLGFYWPFARIATARMRLQAVTVHMTMSPDELASTLRQRADDASGDAAGDFFGIDIGL
jgi:uncharacterized membrane protein YjgN (DUF898 family)